MNFTYFCRQLTDGNNVIGENWGELDEKENVLLTNESNENIEVPLEPFDPPQDDGCFGTGVGKR